MTAEKNYENKPFLLKGNREIGILLLHGWTSPPDELLPLAKYLNSFGYTVYAPLLRGHGTKPEDLLGVTWRDWLHDAKRALGKLKKYAEKIFVSGVSMGGNLALLVSGDREVKGIILLGAPVRFPFRRTVKSSLFLMGLAKTYRKKYFPPWIKKKRGERLAYSCYPVKNAKEVIRLAETAEKFLPRVTKPILIMQSDVDHMSSKKSPHIIVNKVKSRNKEIFWMKNAYHVFVGDKKVWEKIADFISRVEP